MHLKMAFENYVNFVQHVQAPICQQHGFDIMRDENRSY